MICSSIRQQLMKQLHPVRNPSSLLDLNNIPNKQTLWWSCIRGHVWQASLLDRTRDNRCPKCKAGPPSLPEIRIFNYIRARYSDAELQALVMCRQSLVEVDIFVEALHLAIEFDGPHHCHPQRIRKDERKNWLLQSAGMRLIRIRSTDLPRLQLHGATTFTLESEHPAALTACLQSVGLFITERYHQLPGFQR